MGTGTGSARVGIVVVYSHPLITAALQLLARFFNLAHCACGCR
jgi:hypothetical protein